MLLFPASLEFVVSYFACLMAGIVAVPLMLPRRNAGYDSSAAIIADCQPRIALTLPDDALPGAALRQRLEAAGVEPLGVGRSNEPSETLSFRNGRDDLAFLQYTSGSTSQPKGVMVSHGNLVDNLEMIRARYGNHAGSTHVGWIPHYHDLGLIMNLLQPLYLGACSVIMRPAGFMLRRCTGSGPFTRIGQRWPPPQLRLRPLRGAVPSRRDGRRRPQQLEDCRQWRRTRAGCDTRTLY